MKVPVFHAVSVGAAEKVLHLKPVRGGEGSTSKANAQGLPKGAVEATEEGRAACN